MAKKSPVHIIRKSSFWAGTYTAWCGRVEKKSTAQRVVFAGPMCGPCKKARREGKGKR